MQPIQTVQALLRQAQIDSFGICDFPAAKELLPCRNAEHIPPKACSVIVCAFPYYTDRTIPGNLCLYARVPDYHLVVRQLLNPVCKALEAAFPANRFVCFTDVSALPERTCGLRAGLGVIGKNGLLIHPQYGSFFVLGEIVTDLPLPPNRPLPGGCQNCGRCLRACPGGALSENGFQEERCLSFISQRKGTLTAQEEALMRQNRLVWGCDRCQLVCPHNANLLETPIAAFREHIEPTVTEENLSRLRKDRAFGYRSKALMLRNLALFEEDVP